MMASPLFSIIIPTYARPVELVDCLEALARLQLGRDAFEVIIVDDGSPSPPAAVVERFRDRLDVGLITVPHGGPAAARNRGAERATGKFLAFTDDDCRPAANWLDALAARTAAAPDHIVGGRTMNALQRNSYSATSQLIVDLAYAYYNDDGAEARFFASNNMALPADGFRAIGGFDPTFTTSEDRELCDRWLRCGYRMSYAPEAVVYHAHSLNLRRFWWQHFGYGRGAWRFHHIREQRGAGRFRPDLTFYKQLGVAPFANVRGPRLPVIAALVVISQLANCAGFLYERTHAG
jgi:GT2 family glycosyltransferase